MFGKKTGQITGCSRYTWALRQVLYHHRNVSVASRKMCSKSDNSIVQPLDESLLQNLVCPITKKALRYDEGASELISDDIGVAYPIVNGIPNLVPQDGRIIDSNKTKDAS